MSYPRRKVVRALVANGAVLLREGSSHTIVRGPGGKQSSLPRHTDLNRITVRKIVKQLGLEWAVVEKEIV